MLDNGRSFVLMKSCMYMCIHIPFDLLLLTQLARALMMDVSQLPHNS